MNSRVILCINLKDEAERRGISIDCKLLSDMLGIECIMICARRKKDIKLLTETIAKNCSSTGSVYFKLNYPPEIESAADMIAENIHKDISQEEKRFISIKLLDNPKFGLKLLPKSCPAINEAIQSARNYLGQNHIYPVNIRDIITETLVNTASSISKKCITVNETKLENRVLKTDRIFSSKIFGFPIMLIFFTLILWITIEGANYPSQLLSNLFSQLKSPLRELLELLNFSDFWLGVTIDGVYTTTAWVVAVMLPPMAIFFPLFTLLEDSGFLPRIAFNLDRCFKKTGSCGRQALTMCMGLGCNAVGVTGCRIISSPKERIAAIITNTFMPCNGRFGLLTTLSAIFIGSYFGNNKSSVAAAIFVLILIITGAFITLLVTRILTSTLLKGDTPAFILELPPYRPPQIIKTLTRSLVDRTLKILLRAISVAAPTGAVIWLMANTIINDASVLSHLAKIINPFAETMGLDGAILLAFILALPANEIVMPIILMCYTTSTHMIECGSITNLSTLLYDNGWTILTALNVMLFSLLHFPCATTLRTIKAETGSFKWTLIAFLIPTIIAILVCMITNLSYTILVHI